jgi:hypothetical protein
MLRFSTITSGAIVAVSLVLPATKPAAAFPIAAPRAPPEVPITLINRHCNNNFGGHRTIHGSDTYLDDQNRIGLLFKSFATGTLFSRDDGMNDEADKPPRDTYRRQ